MPCKMFDFSGSREWKELLALLEKRHGRNQDIEKIVTGIIEEVQTRGDEALIEYTRKFDCPEFNASQLRVPHKALMEAAASICPEDRALIEESIENIRSFHHAQVEQSWFKSSLDGSIVGQEVRPLKAAGLYVPGGQGGETPLISTLLMTALPAIEAGVKEIAVVSPPGKNGTLNKYLLATAHILGLDEVYAAGSAWAIAALAYGTESIHPVDVIAGPGNIYVTCAKRLVSGKVSIDMLAGPSEILIVADEKSSPILIAADMLAQAEHDPLASAICISDSKILLESVNLELKAQMGNLPRREIAKESLTAWGALVKVRNLKEAVRLANQVAPEHLELMVESPWSMLGQVQNAGAVFIGSNTPEAMGDYFAGPNHVLPTMGTARFSSALSVQTFMKKINIIFSSSEYAQESAPKIARLARLEGLEAHARSAELRRLVKTH